MSSHVIVKQSMMLLLSSFMFMLLELQVALAAHHIIPRFQPKDLAFIPSRLASHFWLTFNAKQGHILNMTVLNNSNMIVNHLEFIHSFPKPAITSTRTDGADVNEQLNRLHHHVWLTRIDSKYLWIAKSYSLTRQFHTASRIYNRILGLDGHDRHVIVPRVIHTIPPITTGNDESATSSIGVIFTEFVNGGTFHDFLKAADQGACIWILYHVAKSLRFLHRQAHIIHGSITLKHIYLHLSPNGKSLHSVALGIHDSAIDLHPYFNILQQQQQPPLDNTNITDIIIEHQLSDIQDLCDVINLELNGFLNAIEFDELSLIVPHELENPTTDLDLLITNIEMWVDENLKSAFVLEEDLPLDEFQLAYFCQTRAMLDTVDEEGMFITDNTSEVSLAHLTVASDFCSSEKQRGQQMDLLILKYGSQIYKHSDTFGISPLEYAVMNLQGDTTASILRHAASEAENLRRRVALAAAAANMKQQSDFASYYPNDVMTGTNVMSSAIRSAGDTRAGTSGIKDLGEMFQEQGIPDSAGVGRGRSSIQRQPPPIVPLFPSIRQQQQQQLPHQQQQHGINEGDVMECKWNALHRIKSLQLFTEAIVNTTYSGLSSASVLNIAEYLTNSPMDSLKRIGQAVYKFIEQQRNHQQNTNDDDGDDDKENGSEQSLSELSSSSSRSPFPPAISLKRSASTESSSSAAAAFTTSSRLLNKKRLKMNREGEKTVGGMSIASMVI